MFSADIEVRIKLSASEYPLFQFLELRCYSMVTCDSLIIRTVPQSKFMAPTFILARLAEVKMVINVKYKTLIIINTLIVK